MTHPGKFTGRNFVATAGPEIDPKEVNPTCSLFYKMIKKSGGNADFSWETRVVF